MNASGAQVLKDALFLSGAQIAANLAAFAIPWSVARFLGDTALGMFAAAYAMAQVISAASDLGMRMALIRETAHHPQAWRGLLQAAWVASSLFGGMAFLLFLGAVAFKEGITGQALRIALGLYGVLWSLFRITLGVPAGLGRLVTVALWTTCERLLLALLVLAGALAHFSLTQLATGMCAAESAFVLAAWLWVQSLAGGDQETLSWRGFWRTALPFGGAALVQGWLGRADLLVLGVAVHPKVLGHYAAGQTLALAALFLAASAASALFPRLAALHRQHAAAQARALFMRVARPMGIALIGTSGLLAVLAPWIVEWIYGNAFAQAAFWLRWFSAMLLWSGIGALEGALGGAWGLQGWWTRALLLCAPLLAGLMWMVRNAGASAVGGVAVLASWLLAALYWHKLAKLALVDPGWFWRTSLIGWMLWGMMVFTHGWIPHLFGLLASIGAAWALRVGRPHDLLELIRWHRASAS